jgi:hypothetical protein
VFRKELLDALRDRRTLLMVLLSSVAMGPVVLVLISTLASSFEKRAEAREVVVAGIAHAPGLRNYLERQTYTVKEAPPDYEQQLKDSRLQDPVLVVPADFEPMLRAGEVPVLEVVSHSANQRSQAGVGRLTGLAPGEQLYAVRYVGDTAYLVTFLRTDPLFAIDLSDPAAPTLLGELVVPGFSNYLHSVGDGLLLGIGQEREPDSWNTRVHATLFDVSDGANLTQIEREFLDPGYQWSWSNAQFDHHALLYSEQDGLLVVPVSGAGYDPQTGYRSGQYLKVLRVGPAGIEAVGEIHPDEQTLRTVRIGDVLYAVGDTTVTAYRISDLREIGSSAAQQAVV